MYPLILFASTLYQDKFWKRTLAQICNGLHLDVVELSSDHPHPSSRNPMCCGGLEAILVSSFVPLCIKSHRMLSQYQRVWLLHDKEPTFSMFFQGELLLRFPLGKDLLREKLSTLKHRQENVEILQNKLQSIVI